MVTLAINPGANPNEARNAAMQACRLIAEHKLLEGPPQHRGPLPPGMGHVVIMDWGPPLSGEDGPTMADLLDTLFEVQRANDRARESAKAESAQPPPQHRVPTAGEYPHNRLATEPGWCAGCGQRYTEGQVVIVGLDQFGREHTWHRPCWSQGQGRK